MVKLTTTRSFVSVTLQPNLPIPLYRQLYRELREAILSGRLTAGTRLPSTRWLANELDLARNTVLTAFEQLIAEGYLESRVGDGTYVTHALPDDMLQTNARLNVSPANDPSGRVLSERGATLSKIFIRAFQDVNEPPEHPAFRAGVPAIREFPFKLWA